MSLRDGFRDRPSAGRAPVFPLLVDSLQDGGESADVTLRSSYRWWTFSVRCGGSGLVLEPEYRWAGVCRRLGRIDAAGEHRFRPVRGATGLRVHIVQPCMSGAEDERRLTCMVTLDP